MSKISKPKSLREASPQDLQLIGVLCAHIGGTKGRILYNGEFVKDNGFNTATVVSEEHIELACRQWLRQRRADKRASTE